MRKSMLLTVYINMAVTLMKLNHFSLAKTALEDAKQITDKSS